MRLPIHRKSADLTGTNVQYAALIAAYMGILAVFLQIMSSQCRGEPLSHLLAQQATGNSDRISSGAGL